MKCPKCEHQNSKVIDSRGIQSSSSIRRRRSCLKCEFRFTTYEYTLKYPVMIIKKNGDREEYDRLKIEKSFHIACNKRPISEGVIQESIVLIEENIINSDRLEVESKKIGEMIMRELKKIDNIAYIRFASVYREFKDIGDFQSHILDLKNR
ncbi:MAG: transcriptional regulator NrdR [Candidatus Marinimicrobia bacterium]|nr:transcriptional regulator NrdR [Candidatus Neomarinimicrobiota bacterium]|tara:strand:+ start:5687 stop:6139 length:453 start_codon:yes stop_codon:yes gene_type:complete